MSRVRIEAPSGPNAHGTRIFMEDHELQEVVDIALRFPVDGIAQVDVRCNLEGGFKWEGPAEVNLHLHLPEGTQLLETTTHNMKGQHFILVKATPENRRIEWECGCVTTGVTWDHSGCTGACHGAGSGTKCTQSPLDHSAYSGTKARMEHHG